MKNKFTLVLLNYFIVFVFISFQVSNNLALETLMSCVFITVFTLTVGAIWTFIVNIFNGLSFQKELWVAWFDNAKTYSVVLGLLYLNFAFVFHIIDTYFVD